MSFETRLAVGFLFGIGFGFFVQRGGLCFAHGIAELYMGMGRRILKLFLVIFVITSLGFLASGHVSADLGLKPIGQIRGSGFYNLLSGMIFGAGIALNGGCILGTLRQIGEGHLIYMITLLSFIPGMALVVYGINPLLESGYEIQGRLLPQLLGVPAPYVTGVLASAAVIGFACVGRRRSRRRSLKQADAADPVDRSAA